MTLGNRLEQNRIAKACAEWIAAKVAIRSVKQSGVQREQYERLGFVPEHGLVFDSLVGTPLDYDNLMRDYAALKQQAGVPPATFHDLRHWHASMLIEEGIDIRLIAKRLGHAGPHITLKTYAHLFNQDQQIEVISLDDILPDFEEAPPRYLN